MSNFKFLLFVDDDLASNYYHEYILKDVEIVEETKSFLSSQEALNFLKSASEKGEAKLPDVIFLALNIHEINGWDFVKEFEKIELEKQPKIIFLSNSSNPDDKKNAAELNNVIELINKPLTIDYLIGLNSRLAS